MMNTRLWGWFLLSACLLAATGCADESEPDDATDTVEGEPDEVKATYKVRPGDTLSSLAKRFSTSVQALKKANPAIRDPLQFGQALKIPRERRP
jgi:peptidoglycan DL-endopeptidase CwlS